MARYMYCLGTEVAGRQLGKLCVPLHKERRVIRRHYLILFSSGIRRRSRKRSDAVFQVLEEKPVRKTF